MKKKAISLIVAIALLFSSRIPAFAAVKDSKSTANSDIHILWINTDDAKAYLNVSGNLAECTAIIDGKSGTTKITGTALLKRVEGNVKTTIKAWTDISVTGDTLYFDRSYYIVSGYTYEFEFDANVYKDGTSEYVSVTTTNY